MIPRILSFDSQSAIISALRNIKVDEYGIKIMSPKAFFYLIKLIKVSSIAANILKQEMLSIGGDIAISRNSITGKDKYTDCIIMGNFVQLERLIGKLKMQPFGLNGIGRNLLKAVCNYRNNNFLIKCRGYSLNTSSKTLIMGIINITADSFSGDGLLAQEFNLSNQHKLKDTILKKAAQMIEDGADIIDIGAESSRPGAKPIDAKEETKRISICLKALVKEFKIPISVDTYKPKTAKSALDLGASIINDITGLRNTEMRKLVARHRAGVVIMHMKGTPSTMQKKPEYKSLIDEIIFFLENAVNSAVGYGIPLENIIIDPGIGFGKTLEHNLEILKNLKEFKVLGRPILAGVSRKSFIGKIINTEPNNRIFGTAAAAAVCVNKGVNILRVHDIREMREVVKICNAINNKSLTQDS